MRKLLFLLLSLVLLSSVLVWAGTEFSRPSGGGGQSTLSSGEGTFAVDSSGNVTATSYTATKGSGIAGDLGLVEGNSTDTNTAGLRGPANIAASGSYRGQLPNARPTVANSVMGWAASSSGAGTPADPYICALSWLTPANLGSANMVGTFASPVTTDSYALAAANGYNTVVFYGALNTNHLDLPDGVAGMNILIYNMTPAVLNIDPAVDNAIAVDGTGNADGHECRLAAATGNFVTLICDVAKHWVTLGAKGVLVAE